MPREICTGCSYEQAKFIIFAFFLANYENIYLTHFKQLSADIKTKARANKTSINIMIFILIFVENCLYFDAIHDFSVWLRTGSNPTDSNRFRSHTGK